MLYKLRLFFLVLSFSFLDSSAFFVLFVCWCICVYRTCFFSVLEAFKGRVSVPIIFYVACKMKWSSWSIGRKRKEVFERLGLVF